MGRGKRLVAISRARAGISLSDTPRARKRVPVFASLASYDYSSGFAPIVTRIVGLHVHDAWNLAEEVYGQDVELALLREPDNADDPNAVVCWQPFVAAMGYVDADVAEQVATALDNGTRLVACPLGTPPWAGQGSKGGSLEVRIVAASS